MINPWDAPPGFVPTIALEELPTRTYHNGKAVEALPIQQDVPMPDDPREPSSPLFAAARIMKVGESVAIPYDRKQKAANLERATKFQAEFKQRTVVENGVKMLRFWRIK